MVPMVWICRPVYVSNTLRNGMQNIWISFYPTMGGNCLDTNPKFYLLAWDFQLIGSENFGE